MSIMKFIKSCGRLVVRMYVREAQRLNLLARKEAVLSRELAERSRKLADQSEKNVTEAAKVSAQAQQLGKFFE